MVARDLTEHVLPPGINEPVSEYIRDLIKNVRGPPPGTAGIRTFLRGSIKYANPFGSRRDTRQYIIRINRNKRERGRSRHSPPRFWVKEYHITYIHIYLFTVAKIRR